MEAISDGPHQCRSSPLAGGEVSSSVKPPVGAENLCEQAILVNHAAGAVTALDAELIQIGDAVG